MKLRVLIFSLFIFGSVSAQVYKYAAFPKGTGEWIYSEYDDNYHFTGLYYNGYWVDSSTGKMRNPFESYYEVNKRIYYNNLIDTTFKLLYDFNLTVGDTFVNAFFDSGFYNDSIGVVWSDDSISPSSSLWPNRRVLIVGNATWVEGIGNVSSWGGIEHPLSNGTLSGGLQFSCIYADSASYPCNNISVNEIEPKPIEFSIYPNPSSNEFNLILPKEVGSVELYLLNTQGKIVLNTAVNTSHSKICLPILPNGLYVVRLKQNGKLLFTEKLSITR